MNPLPRQFPSTRWTIVAAARDGADRSPEALNAICRSYWYPLYAYARGRGIPAPDAEDMTQEFFRLLLEKHGLDKADPRRGRLRTFLIVAMKKFMANEWRRAAAQERSGGKDLVPLDIAVAESRYAAEPPSGADGDEVFDRQWALNLIELALNRLCDELSEAGQGELFDLLKDCLMADRGAIDYESLAQKLGSTPGATRVAVHRFRKRFRQIFRDEVGQTLPVEADVREELRYMAAVLGQNHEST